jgi:hypothetical protein
VNRFRSTGMMAGDDGIISLTSAPTGWDIAPVRRVNLRGSAAVSQVDYNPESEGSRCPDGTAPSCVRLCSRSAMLLTSRITGPPNPAASSLFRDET